MNHYVSRETKEARLPSLTKNEIWLQTIVQKNNYTITDIELSRLTDYCLLLEQWNKKINLISRRDEENIWLNHILVSLVFLFKIQIPDGSNVLDLGTGGGLPGIPLSIMRHDINFVLLDSIRKKTVAVQEMVSALGLPNVKIVCSRAEDLGHQKTYRHSFDAVIARAVSSLENIVLWGAPLLKKGNATHGITITAPHKVVLAHPVVITMKGGDIADEAERVQRRFPHIKLHQCDTTFSGSEVLQNSERKIILIETNEGQKD